MAKFKLSDGFKDLQVGNAQTLLVKRVKYNEKFQKIAVTFADGQGGTCVENFNLVDDSGRENAVANGIFSTIFKCCKGGETGDEVDPTEIEGCYIVADVYQQIVKNEEGGEKRRYTHVKNFREADGGEAVEDDGEEEGSWY